MFFYNDTQVYSFATAIFTQPASYVFNSRKTIAGAIIGLLLVFCLFLEQPYDVTIISNLLFDQSFMQLQLNFTKYVIFLLSDGDRFVMKMEFSHLEKKKF